MQAAIISAFITYFKIIAANLINFSFVKYILLLLYDMYFYICIYPNGNKNILFIELYHFYTISSIKVHSRFVFNIMFNIAIRL